MNYDNGNPSDNLSFLNHFDNNKAPPGKCKAKAGTFWSDINDITYNLKWPDMAACTRWMEHEARRHHFHFVRGYSNKNVHSEQLVFSCSSGSTGGDRKYVDEGVKSPHKRYDLSAQPWSLLYLPHV
jgi:hypothetical protein